MKKIWIALCAALLCACSAVDEVRHGVLNTKQDVEDALTPTQSSGVREFSEDAEYIFTGPTTVLDNEYITVTLDSVVCEYSDWYYFNLTYQNKTDQTLVVTMDSMSVNELCWSGFGYDELKKNGSLSYSIPSYNYSPKETRPDNVRFNFRVDDKDYHTLCTDNGTVYFNGEENAVSDLYEIKDTDQILMDNDCVTIVDMGSIYVEDNWAYKPLYVYNKTEEEYYLRSENIFVNGTETDLFDYATLPPKCGAYFELDLYEDDLEECGFELEDVHELTVDWTLLNTQYDTITEETVELN